MCEISCCAQKRIIEGIHGYVDAFCSHFEVQVPPFFTLHFLKKLIFWTLQNVPYFIHLFKKHVFWEFVHGLFSVLIFCFFAHF